MRAIEDQPGHPMKRSTSEIGKTIDARSWESTNPPPSGPSRSSRLSRTSRVKETMRAVKDCLAIP